MKYLLVFVYLFVCISGFAQDTTSFQREDFDALAERSKLKYTFVPLPSYDPSTKLGLTATNIFTFYPDKLDTISPPSMLAVGVQATTNGSWMLGGGGTVYLKNDTWRLNPQLIYGQINQELDLGNANLTDAKRVMTVVNLQGHRLVWNRIYLGFGYSFRKIDYRGRDSLSTVHLEDAKLTDADGNHGLKYFLTQDKRDNVNYPYSGHYAAIRAEQYFETGDATAYWANYVDWRQFINVGDIPGQHVIAYRFLGRFLAGTPQPQNYTYYGRTGGDIERGYETGKYIDRDMVNVEVEYRLETSMINNKLGFTALAGVGKVYGEYYDFSDADWLPVVGAGVRYRLLPYERMNIRLDLTVGNEGMVAYFGIREAF